MATIIAAARGGRAGGHQGGRVSNRGGRSGRGRGGRGRGGRLGVINTEPRVAGRTIRTGLPTAVEEHIPNRLRVPVTGWEEIDMVKEKYELLTEDEFTEKYMSNSFIDTYLHAAESMERHLHNSGLEVNTVNTITSLVSEGVFVDLATYATQVLVKRRLPRVTADEMEQFLATRLLRSRFRISSTKAWTAVLGPIAKKNGFQLMDMDRYNNILTSIRGYEVNNRSGDNGTEVWMQRRKVFRNLNDIEKNMFKNSFSLLFNTKNGSLVIDDELISTRAKDVETKVINNKKAGNEGLHADQVAESNVGFLYGSRISVTGESQEENVQKLLETAPTNTQRDRHPSVALDRGYCKESMFVHSSLQPFEVVSICNAASRNPFVLRSDADEVIHNWRNKKHFQVLDEDGKPMKEEYTDDNGKTKMRNMLDADKVKECSDIFEKWILDDYSMHGSAVRVATKDVANDDGKKVFLTAFAIHDIYDKKATTKHLRFLATGKASRQMNHIWVASDKTSVTVTSNHLFSDKKGSTLRQKVEQTLRDNGCSPQTILQRSMDWFALKGMMLTGTIGGIVHSAGKKIVEQQDGLSQETIDFDDDLYDETLSDVFDECIKSWFGRGRTTTTAMSQGTKNEEPTLECFAQMDCVKAVFEVGLLKWNSDGNIGVSPDGIAVVKIPDNDRDDCNEDEIACVEIKTRVVENTIEAAEEAREWATSHSINGDGKVVVCDYDDDVFKKCVPSGNRKQVIHQAVVTGLSWGVFITAKVEDGEDGEPGQGSIVQTVFVHMSDDAKDEYSEPLLLVAKQINDWMLNPEAVARGYLTDEDFPRWIKSDAKEIIKSHFKLWSAFYRRVEEKGPLSPVGMINHSINFKYNKSKWGVDQCTDTYIKISGNGNEKQSAEAKYVMRMFDGVIGNSWKTDLARTVVKPFVNDYKEKHGGKLPSIATIRNKCKTLPLDDYVFDASIQWLQQLELKRNCGRDIRTFFAAAKPTLNSSREQLDDVLSMLNERKRRDWPVTKNRVKKFAKDPTLHKTRLFSNNQFMHEVITLTDKAPSCALCTAHSAQRKVQTCCSKCEVTLCVLPRPPSNTSCWEAWHAASDLKAEAKLRSDALVAQRQREKEPNNARHQSRMATARERRRRSRDESMADASAVSPVAASGNDVASSSNMSNGDNAADVHSNDDGGGGGDIGVMTTIDAAAAVGGSNVVAESNVTHQSRMATARERRRRSRDESMADASAVSPVVASDNDVASSSNMSNGDNAADVHSNDGGGGGGDIGVMTTIDAAAAVGGSNVVAESNVTAGGNNDAAAGNIVVAETIVAGGNDANGMASINDAVGNLHLAGESHTRLRSPLRKRTLRSLAGDLFPNWTRRSPRRSPQR